MAQLGVDFGGAAGQEVGREAFVGAMAGRAIKQEIPAAAAGLVVWRCRLSLKPGRRQGARRGAAVGRRRPAQFAEQGGKKRFPREGSRGEEGCGGGAFGQAVEGWDDPRMPTLCGLRRRGYTAGAVRDFCERIGVAKVTSTIEYAFLEHCLREDLNETAARTMAVLRPVKLVVTNYPEGKSETFTVENNPVHPEQGSHEITFSREVWVEADDFLETPVPKYKRLYPGSEVRLKGAYLVTCTGCEKDAAGNVTKILCTYDPESRGGDPADGRKVKGATLHWVDAAAAVDAEVRLYDNLFSDPQPDGPDKNFLDCMNPDSLTVLQGCKVESGLVRDAAAFDALGDRRASQNAPAYQFMRVGYFCMDNRDCREDRLVFNRSVSLKDSYKPQTV